MLNPSTRATWTPKVTISVAYTAADTSVCTPDQTSWAIRAHALAAGAATEVAGVSTSAVTGSAGSGGGISDAMAWASTTGSIVSNSSVIRVSRIPRRCYTQPLSSQAVGPSPFRQ